MNTLPDKESSTVEFKASFNDEVIEEIANEHLKSINLSWDFYIDPTHSVADLSEVKMAKFINRIKQNRDIQQIGLSDTDMLHKREILRNGQITFGAYLLFVKDYCSISDIQLGRFKSDITIIDAASLNADLFQEVDDIMAFIKKHLQIEYIITGEPQRTERFDYPLDAIREIVINMVVHRDYRDSSASIIKIFDDRIEFYNPGKLYGGLTVPDLLSGNYTSKSRNKLIAKAFKEAGMIERYGSGIMRVHKICTDYGSKEPDFNEIFNGFQVILYGKTVVENGKTVVKNGKTVVESEKTVVKIMAIIKENPKITIKELVELTGLSRRGIEYNIQKIKEKGLIERVGTSKDGYWNIINEDTISITVNDTENITVNEKKDTVNEKKDTVNKKKDTVNKKNGTVNEKNITVNGTVNEENITVNEKKDTVNERNITVNKKKDTVKLSKSQKIIMKEIENNPHITSKELSDIIGIDAVNIRVNLSKLKDKGLIERIGADKNGYWVVIKK
jgi:ATP-dependent DNA helicase RecG